MSLITLAKQRRIAALGVVRARQSNIFADNFGGSMRPNRHAAPVFRSRRAI